MSDESGQVSDTSSGLPLGLPRLLPAGALRLRKGLPAGVTMRGLLTVAIAVVAVAAGARLRRRAAAREDTEVLSLQGDPTSGH